MTRGNRLPLILLTIDLLVLVWSGVQPHDRFTWFLEVLPALVAIPFLIVTYRRFRLTDLAYVLVAVHAAILMVGGKYTYAEVPAFNWLREAMHGARNEYDHVGHFAQGLVPAILAREVLLRRNVVQRGRWLAFIVVSICLAVSATYELFEWSMAVATGGAADAFLGTQGDPFDTQKDMAWAFVGAVLALVLLSKLHDRQLSLRA